MRHNSSLVCMVEITYVFIDMIFTFYGYILFLYIYPSLLLSWVFEHDCWTHAVLDVFYAYVLYFVFALVQCS